MRLMLLKIHLYSLMPRQNIAPRKFCQTPPSIWKWRQKVTPITATAGVSPPWRLTVLDCRRAMRRETLTGGLQPLSYRGLPTGSGHGLGACWSS